MWEHEPAIRPMVVLGWMLMTSERPANGRARGVLSQGAEPGWARMGSETKVRSSASSRAYSELETQKGHLGVCPGRPLRVDSDDVEIDGLDRR